MKTLPAAPATSHHPLWLTVLLFAMPLVLPLAVFVVLVFLNYTPTFQSLGVPLEGLLAFAIFLGWVSLWFTPMRLAFRVIAMIVYIPLALPAMMTVIRGFICLTGDCSQ